MQAIVTSPARIRETVTILGPDGFLVIIVNAARLARTLLDATAVRLPGGWGWEDMTITSGEPDPAGTAELLRRLTAILELTSAEQEEIRIHVLRDLRVSIDPGHSDGSGSQVPSARGSCTGRAGQPG